jgi:hypothetical protein
MLPKVDRNILGFCRNTAECRVPHPNVAHFAALGWDSTTIDILGFLQNYRDLGQGTVRFEKGAVSPRRTFPLVNAASAGGVRF